MTADQHASTSEEANIVEIDLPTGRSLAVRINPIDADAVGTGASKVSFNALTFAELAETVGDIADALGTVLERSKPTKASVKFGLEVAAKTGKLFTLLVDGEGKGTINVTLEWSKDGA